MQAVLTAFYEDIKGVQGGSGCPKTKILKRLFKDQEDAEQRRKDEAGIEDASGAAAAPASGAAAAAPPAGGEEPAAAPAFAEPVPSPPERRRDWMVRGLRADAD